MRCNIPKPFVGQTSFLSESAHTAPDVNSFVQNHDKQAMMASQLSISSENFSNRANDVLSQDVGSSSASLVDPLCSVVPCSIPENPCSSPTMNYGDPILPIAIECKKDCVLGAPSLQNMLSEGEKLSRQTADNNDSGNGVSRLSNSLRDYSMLLPSHSKLFGKDSRQKSSFLTERSPKLTFQETSYSNREEAMKAGAKLQVLNKENSVHTPSFVVNHRIEPHFRASSSMHNFTEENLIGTAQPESIMKHLQPKILQCENQSAQKLPAQKRVHFSERETNIPDNKKNSEVANCIKTL